MAEADDKPVRCPCGFWGSPRTMNLCSQCYKDHIQKASQTSSASDNNANKNATATSSLLTGLLSLPLGPPMATTNSTQPPATIGDHSPSSVAPAEPMETTTTTQEDQVNETLSNQSAESLPERPVQKNKKKCWICRAKLELAQRELGHCKCGYVFCLMHRLPEQHECVFDHKDSGRQEAMKNMVDTGKKKIGRSFHRMDSKA